MISTFKLTEALNITRKYLWPRLISFPIYRIRGNSLAGDYVAVFCDTVIVIAVNFSSILETVRICIREYFCLN